MPDVSIRREFTVTQLLTVITAVTYFVTFTTTKIEQRRNSLAVAKSSVVITPEFTQQIIIQQKRTCRHLVCFDT